MAFLQPLLAVILYLGSAQGFSLFGSESDLSSLQSYVLPNTAYQELIHDGNYVFGCRTRAINKDCPYDQRVDVTREYVAFLCDRATYHLRGLDFHCLSAGPVALTNDATNNVRCKSLSTLPYLPLNEYGYQRLCIKKHWWQRVFGRK